MADTKRAVFRCDASPVVGGGHVMRTMTLARGLSRVGWDIGFAVSSETCAFVPQLEQAGWYLEGGFDSEPSEVEHLKSTWRNGVDLFVIDHYERDHAYEHAVGDWAANRLAVDDFANRSHSCELLLDTSVGRSESDYRDLVPGHAKVLVGSDYALLRDEFSRSEEKAIHNQRTGRVAECGSVLLSFGLSDPGAIAAQAYKVVRPIVPEVSIDIVLNKGTESEMILRSLQHKDPALNILILPDNLAKVMSRSDIAIGAGGQQTFERCALGLPTVAISLVEHQVDFIEAFARRGALVHVRGTPKLDVEALSASFRNLAYDACLRHDMSQRARAICDGKGVERVVQNITELLS